MRVLIVGLGSIASKHISVLNQIDENVVIYALRSAKNALKQDGIINIYDIKDIYDLNVDFAILSNPTALHYEYLKYLKELNIPLFIEKPLFDKVGLEQYKLVKSIVNANIPTFVACNIRFLDSIIKIRRIIQSERVNEVNVYCGSYLPDWRPNVDFRTVYSANKEMGGGVHIDLIHELDYIYWIFDEPIKTNSIFLTKSSLKISACDYANYVWIYDEFAVNIILNYFRKDAKRSLEIICDSGTYYVDLLKNKIYFKDQVIYESNQQTIDRFKSQMLFFIESVVKKNDKFNSIDHAYKILKLCLKD